MIPTPLRLNQATGDQTTLKSLVQSLNTPGPLPHNGSPEEEPGEEPASQFAGMAEPLQSPTEIERETIQVESVEDEEEVERECSGSPQMTETQLEAQL